MVCCCMVLTLSEKVISLIIDLATDDLKYREFDFCVIGAGAAGIYLASELTKFGTVGLLEAGGREYDERSQKNYSGRSVGSYHLPYGVEGSRLRFLGGSTNCWAGGCAKFEELDFKKREWINRSGWPIQINDLNSHYQNVSQKLEIDDLFKKASKGTQVWKETPYPFELKMLVYTEKKLFAEEYAENLETNNRLSLILNFNAIELEGMSRKITKVKGVNYDGTKFEILSRVFIVTCGGIAGTNFLQFNSHFLDPKARSNLGKSFQDHPIAPCATIVFKDDISLPTAQDFWRQNLNPFFVLPESIQREHKLLNCGLQIYKEPRQLSKATVSALKIRKKLKGENISLKFSDIKGVIMNPLEILQDLRNRKNKSGLTYTVRFQLEQAPNQLSKLSIEKNNANDTKLQTVLDWNMTPLERRTVDVNLAFFAKFLLDEGIGVLDVDWQLIEDFENLPFALRGGQHHSGTCRMAESADTGVVDPNLKVFGTSNLYVCSSAVFPTNSWANPTFTILALADRLASHLEDKSNFTK